MQFSAAAVLTSCAPKLLNTKDLFNEAVEAEFFVASSQIYLGYESDFSKTKFSKKIGSPIANLPEKFHAQLCAFREKNTVTNLVHVPGLVHAATPDADLLFLATTGHTFPLLYTLDARTLEVACINQLAMEKESFGGHVARIPGTDVVAVVVNSNIMGHYDRLSLRDRHTLKEIGSYSTYGFEAHDVQMSPDGKKIIVGHYGSLIGSGVYKDLAIKTYLTDGKGSGLDNIKSWDLKEHKTIYPACLTVIDRDSGKLIRRLSSVDNGSHCHFTVDEDENLYLPRRPSRIVNREDSEYNPWFKEGVHGGEQVPNFLPRPIVGFGTAIDYDRVNHEVIIPARWVENVHHFPKERLDAFDTYNLQKTIPSLLKAHGVAFHPNGRDYVITGSNWLAMMERKTHRFIPDRSVTINLMTHSHVYSRDARLV